MERAEEGIELNTEEEKRSRRRYKKRSKTYIKHMSQPLEMRTTVDGIRDGEESDSSLELSDKWGLEVRKVGGKVGRGRPQDERTDVLSVLPLNNLGDFMEVRRCCCTFVGYLSP